MMKGIELTAMSIVGKDNYFNHYIGELYGGGIIIALWKISGIEHGLICSLSNQSTSSQWSSVTSGVAGANNISDGIFNTNKIITQGDISGAAYICDNYSYDGYNDWYLPSIKELLLIGYNCKIINTILPPSDGILSTNYWSSYEGSSVNGWYMLFSGNGSAMVKTSLCSVRAVRQF